jgi:hypothetical protein
MLAGGTMTVSSRTGSSRRCRLISRCSDCSALEFVRKRCHETRDEIIAGLSAVLDHFENAPLDDMSAPIIKAVPAARHAVNAS